MRTARTLAVVRITTGSAVVMALAPSSLQAFPRNGGSETSTGSAPAGGAERVQQPSKKKVGIWTTFTAK